MLYIQLKDVIDDSWTTPLHPDLGLIYHCTLSFYFYNKHKNIHKIENSILVMQQILT